MKNYIRNFNDIRIADITDVGVKNAMLGEIANNFKTIAIPRGFVVTTAGYQSFLEYNKLSAELEALTSLLDDADAAAIRELGTAARKLIMKAKIPPALENEVLDSCKSVFGNGEQQVAIRSSAGHYNPAGLFSGYDSYLNVGGSIAVMYAIKCCFASLYSEKAIRFRQSQGIPQNSTLSIGIQEMVRSDLSGSGIGFADYTLGDASHNAVKIKSVWGLGNDKGEVIVPDEHIIDSPDAGSRILYKSLGDKSSMRVYNNPAAGINTTNLKITPPELRATFVLEDPEAVLLAKWVLMIQLFHKGRAVVKWAKDGITRKIFIIGITIE